MHAILTLTGLSQFAFAKGKSNEIWQKVDFTRYTHTHMDVKHADDLKTFLRKTDSTTYFLAKKSCFTHFDSSVQNPLFARFTSTPYQNGTHCSPLS